MERSQGIPSPARLAWIGWLRRTPGAWRPPEHSHAALEKTRVLRALLFDPTVEVHQRHLADRAARSSRQPGASHNDRETLRPRDRDVETIAA